MRSTGPIALEVKDCRDCLTHRLIVISGSGKVDVYGTAKRLLEERRGLISSSDQLKYIYDVIEDHLLCGETFIPIADILPTMQIKSKRSPHDDMNDYQREFKLLSVSKTATVWARSKALLYSALTFADVDSALHHW